MVNNMIDDRIRDARKMGDKDGLRVFKLIKSEFQKFLTSSKDSKLDEIQEVKILMKMLEQWKDEYNTLLENNRDTSLIINDIDILESLIPELPSTEEIQGYTEGVFDVYKANNPNISMKDLKPIMDQVKKKYPLADGSIIAKTFKELLNN